MDDRDEEIRRAYESGELYQTARICVKLKEDSREYTDRLLADRLQIVRDRYQKGPVLDLCCATGEHLLSLSAGVEFGVGLDFSYRYIESARRAATNRGAENLIFVHGNAKALPFPSGYFKLVYSFSSLYTIPNVHEVIGEVSRVLSPGGWAVLDFGNIRSLNTYCVRNYYRDWPPIYPVRPGQMWRMLKHQGLIVDKCRYFQILPLWADKPAWLAPLLHPNWRRLMSRRVFGRMLDEWVSSLPGLRAFAFRYVIICTKASRTDNGLFKVAPREP